MTRGAETHAVELVDLVLPVSFISWDMVTLLRRVARRAPEVGHRILTQPERREAVMPHLVKVLGKTWRSWPQALRQDIFDQCLGTPYVFAKLLVTLPPSEREAHFVASWPVEDRATLIWDDSMMQALPHAIRQQEAARQLSMAAVQQDVSRRVRLSSYLHLDDSIDALVAATRGPVAEERAAGWTASIRAYNVARTPLQPVLAHTSRLANEQDPVRMAAAWALAEIPGGRFEPEDGPLLLTLARHIMDARDTSWGTRSALLNVFKHLMIAHSAHPDSALLRCAFKGILMLAVQANILDLPRLEHHLTTASALSLIEVMLPWLDTMQKRAYNENVLRFIAALGEHAWESDALERLLVPIIWKDSTLRRRAASLWLANPSTRVKRALKLLERDASAFLLPEVADVLHRQRQDLLGPFLEGTSLRGIFGSAQHVYVIPSFHNGFHRWPVALQRIFIATLARTVRDSGQTSTTRASLISRMASIPACTLEDLKEFVDSKEVVVQEAALGALIWLDDPVDALPVLLEYTGGERARVAMYAILRLAKLLAPDVMLEALDELLARERIKITVAKEVMRLLGTLNTAEAAQRARATWARPNVHRDVCIALLHAACALIEFEDARHILATAHAHPDAEVCRAWAMMGSSHVSTSWRISMVTWQLPLVTHEDARVRQAAYTNLGSIPWVFKDQEALQAEFAQALHDEVMDVAQQGSWESAERALVRCLELPLCQGAMSALIGALLERRHDDVSDEARDLPWRQRLARLITEVCKTTSIVPIEALTMCLETITWPGDCWELEAELVWKLTFRELGARVHASQLERVLTRAPSTLDVYRSVEARTAHFHGMNLPAVHEALALYQRCADHTDAMMNFAAVCLVSALGEHYGWTQEWRQALRACRQSTHERVRHHAWRVHMDHE